jgi:DNA-binding NarL/FixJ family response regulator
MTAGSTTGYAAAKQRLTQEGIHIPLQLLIVADLSRCKETIRALLELQDLGCVQILGRVESGVEALQAMTVLLPDLIILDHRQDVGSQPLSSVLTSNFPAIKVLCVAEEDSVRLREASLTCRAQAILSKATLRADLVAALEQISGFTVMKQSASRA